MVSGVFRAVWARGITVVYMKIFGIDFGKKKVKRVLAFGAFDPINEGQKNFLEQAKKLGSHLTVVVAHDSAIRRHKKRDPNSVEGVRIAAVEQLGIADEVVLGRKMADKYHILGELDFDVIAMGYNQEPSDAQVKAELEERDKYNVEVVRLKPYKPEEYPSN